MTSWAHWTDQLKAASDPMRVEYDAERLRNDVAYVNINSWHGPVGEAIYFELYPTELFDSERAAAVISPLAARQLAYALNAVADMWESHNAWKVIR